MQWVHPPSRNLWNALHKLSQAKVDKDLPGFSNSVDTAFFEVTTEHVVLICDCRFSKITGDRFLASLHLGFLPCCFYDSLRKPFPRDGVWGGGWSHGKHLLVWQTCSAEVHTGIWELTHATGEIWWNLLRLLIGANYCSGSRVC